jgi:undecaprenyl diphosphate synthase
MTLLEEIDKNNIPRHVAIIMDGNGRWAKKKGNSRLFGHKNGVKAVREATEAAAQMGVQYLTLYAFSTENWNRPKLEVDGLMTLLVSAIENETKKLNENNIRLHTIGDITRLPKNVRAKLNGAIDNTASNTGMNLILALNYSGKWDITNAVKRISQDIKDNKISVEDINDTLITNNLTTAQFPDPEFLIRTSGECRLSNFLLWELAYAEFYFTETLWPDFSKDTFYEAIKSYQNRERRFGKISEQIKES